MQSKCCGFVVVVAIVAIVAIVVIVVVVVVVGDVLSDICGESDTC